ncbi:hypothetical protein LIER_27991 [Lithospermum erythrorhizon]|uniref:Uncharacterized protein n=1 Tax=Lithospermum erythrorhizon TaxID=34254 RepID=A0AAV3RHM2_LITER
MADGEVAKPPENAPKPPPSREGENRPTHSQFSSYADVVQGQLLSELEQLHPNSYKLKPTSFYQNKPAVVFTSTDKKVHYLTLFGLRLRMMSQRIHWKVFGFKSSMILPHPSESSKVVSSFWKAMGNTRHPGVSQIALVEVGSSEQRRSTRMDVIEGATEQYNVAGVVDFQQGSGLHVQHPCATGVEQANGVEQAKADPCLVSATVCKRSILKVDNDIPGQRLVQEIAAAKVFDNLPQPSSHSDPALPSDSAGSSHSGLVVEGTDLEDGVTCSAAFEQAWWREVPKLLGKSANNGIMHGKYRGSDLIGCKQRVESFIKDVEDLWETIDKADSTIIARIGESPATKYFQNYAMSKSQNLKAQKWRTTVQIAPFCEGPGIVKAALLQLQDKERVMEMRGQGLPFDDKG